MESFFIPFDVKHLDSINIPEEFPVLDNFPAYAEALSKAGPSVTLVVNGEILGCGGVAFPWDGMGEAWMCFDYSVKKYPLSAVKMCRKFLNDVFESCKMVRMQAVVRAGVPSHQKWAKIMGFEYEGTMRKYGHDRCDYMMFGRVRNG